MVYKIPFSYTVDATIEIEAEDLTEAIVRIEYLAKVDETGNCRLIHGYSPIIKSDIDLRSIEVNHELAEDLNPKKNYTVKLIRTQTVEVEVEAHSAEEAERKAIEGAEDGSLEDFSNCTEEEIVAEDIEEI